MKRPMLVFVVVLAIASSAFVIRQLVENFPGGSDFNAELPNGYFIHRTSASEIIVAPDSWDMTTPIIPSKVVRFDHDSNFAIAEREEMSKKDSTGSDFWILQFAPPKVWGPLDAVEFEEKRRTLQVPSALGLHDVYDYRK